MTAVDPSLPTLPVIPIIGAIDDVKPEPDDDRYWSVTTIIGALNKEALVAWAAIETAKAAVDKLDVVETILRNDGRDEAINYLKGARFRRPKGQRTAKDLGTAVHKACEEWALSGVKPKVDAEVAPFLRQFERFTVEFAPQYIATEVTVYSRTYAYAGTLDAIVEIDGKRYIVDYKTSRDSFDGQGKAKGPYSEVALQLAAYRHAELAAVWRARRFESFRRRYYLLSKSEVDQAAPVPDVDGGLVIFLTPDRYAVHAIRCDDAVHEAFLYVLEAARWQFETSKNVIGSPMIPPYPTPDPVDDVFAGLPTE